MANPEHVAILHEGVEAWNEWRKRSPGITPDLHHEDVCGSCLDDVDFHSADLSDAYFIAASVVGADFEGAYLEGADLYGADLTRAKLDGANLRGCQLSLADLTSASLTGAHLYGVAHDDWKIAGIACRYVFWDNADETRSPQDRDYAPGEFEQIYRTLPSIEYVFQNGMTPLDPLIMDRVVQAIRAQNPEYDIKIDSIQLTWRRASIKPCKRLP